MSRCSRAFPPFLEVKRWAGSSFRCCSVNSARSPWESPATILIVLSKNALLVWRPGVMSRASKKKEEGMDIFPWGLAGGAIALAGFAFLVSQRSEEHTSELQSQSKLVCRLLVEKKNATPAFGTDPSRPVPARDSDARGPPAEDVMKQHGHDSRHRVTEAHPARARPAGQPGDGPA